MQKYIFTEIQKEFDPSDMYGQTSFTQASFYGDWQKSLGREVRRFVVKKEQKIVAYFQIIKFALPMGKSYLYIPYGPVIQDMSDDLLKSLKKEIKKITKESNSVFTRLDFSPAVTNEKLKTFFTKAKSYTTHSSSFQPRVEWYLPLSGTEDEILAGMHKKTRYSIRVGIESEVTTKIVTMDLNKYFEDFYTLMTTTANRNRFDLHEKEYYKAVFNSLDKEKSGYLVIVEHNAKVLAISLVVIYAEVASYVFGGSDSEEREKMPSYIAQLEGIKYAKKLGCRHYNFGGISAEKDAHKEWSGLTRFKKRFGGEEVVHSDFFDVVASPLWYFIYNLAKLLKK